MNPLDALRERIAQHASFQRLFDSTNPDARVVLRSIAKEGFITRSTFVAGDPHQTALNEGMRRMALSILRHIHRDHARMIKQVEEMMSDSDA